MNNAVPAVFDPVLSDVSFPLNAMSREQADKLFIYFKQHPLFNWTDANNGCEGRADAVCILLDEWKIPNYKAWVFSGAFLKKGWGGLKNYWNYHVATVLPVQKDEQVLHYVLDPATSGSLQLIDEWAAGITQFATAYYSIKQPHWYIFPAKQITSRKWHSRNKQNRKWMIQCLAGINGLTTVGRARLMFNKKQVKNVAAAFEKAKKDGLGKLQ
jgi:hypothetical protein